MTRPHPDWWDETEHLAEPPQAQDLRPLFDVLPLRNALEYVVEVAKQHLAQGLNDDLVLVARICQAALTWQKLDELGKYEEAERWLKAIPRSRFDRT